MNKTFYGHTPNVNGLLNLDRSDTHIHNIDAKIDEGRNQEKHQVLMVDETTSSVDG